MISSDYFITSNGVVETNDKNLLGKERATKIEVRSNYEFWGDVVYQDTYLYNSTSTSMEC